MNVMEDIRTGVRLEAERIKPWRDRVLIKVLPRPKEIGGIYVERRSASWEGKEAIWAQVLAVGDEVEQDVRVGDTVAIEAHAGKWVGDPEGDPETPVRMVDEEELLLKWEGSQ